MNDKSNKNYFGYIIFSKTHFEPNSIFQTLSICKDDIRTLIDVVIVNSMKANLFSRFCASNILSKSMLENDMMMEMLQDEILKSNNLLPNDLFKWRRTCAN